MTSIQAPARSRPPVLAVLTAVLGLLGAAGSALMASALVGLGALGGDEGAAGWWVGALAVAAVAQAWGAVRLLRRRGRLLLALASVPGLLPAVAFVGFWLEYRQGLTWVELLTAAPLVTLLLLALPPVGRWARPPARGGQGS